MLYNWFYLYAPIRKDDIYSGFRIKLSAIYETIATPLSVDISIGDVSSLHLLCSMNLVVFLKTKYISGFGVIMLKRLWERKRKLFQLEAFLI